MKIKMLRFVMLAAMLFSALTPVTQVQAQMESASSKGVSPAGMLNPDGTLNLSKGFNGALDLSGYSVEMDPKRGPVFGPERSGDNAPASAVAAGNWAGVGDGAGNFNNSIYDIAVSGTDVYVVGNFTDVANISAADYVAKWNGSSWSALGANGAGDGALNRSAVAVAVSGTDVYVGGYFDKVYNGASQVSGAAYIAKWNGSSWSALGNDGAGGPSLNDIALDIVVSGTDVYAGGWFTNVKDGVTTLNEADYVAKWDTTSSHWSALGNGGAGIGSLNNGVNALAVSGANIYAGGSFTDVKNGVTTFTEADYIAKWDALTGNWSALGNNGAGNGSLDYDVFALAVNGTDLYVGGEFTSAKNGPTTVTGAAHIARWNTTNSTWNALGTTNFIRDVYSLAIDAGGNVYVGGIFTNVMNGASPLPEADYIAKFDPLSGNWSAVGNNDAGDGSIPDKAFPYTTVNSLAMQGSTLLVGGYFFDVNDEGAVQPQADHLASWNGTHWSSVGTNVNGTFSDPTNPINAIAVIGTDVYVGGRFSEISNHGINLPEADNIVKWDGTNWSALGSNGAGNGSLNGEVFALAVSGTDLYVGGWFSDVNNNGTPLPVADYIAKWDTLAENWSALGSTAALNYVVFSITVDGSGNLYAGGAFTNINNNGTVIPEGDYIAKWDGSNWSALGSNGSGDGALNYYVNALVMNGSNVVAGGYFTNAASIPEADYIAKWNGVSWSALGSNNAGDGALNGSVFALAKGGTTVYVGGLFSDVNNNGISLPEADYIAKWDGANWSALGSNGAGDGSMSAPIFAVAVDGDGNVYAGGGFTNVNNKGTVLTAADYVAKWDGTDWSALGSNGAGEGTLNQGLKSLTVNVTNLFAGGFFGDVSNNGTVIKEADRLAVWGIVPHVPVTLTVTKLADTDDGVCSVTDCSLREAIGAAKNGDTIVFAGGLSGTITLNATLMVDKTITITGPGASTISVSGNDLLVPFFVQAWATVQISNLTITHGYTSAQSGGGIINNGGTLTLDHIVVSNSRADSSDPIWGNGGGIYNTVHGNLTITNSQITGNSASHSGGGIYNGHNSSLSLTDTVVDHNTSYGDGGGLSLPNPGTDSTPFTNTLTRVSVTDNIASGSGGSGILLSASASISNSLIANNNANGLAGAGGGLKLYEGGAGFAPITVGVTNVTISGNATFHQGGGVDVNLQQAADSVILNNVTIANNHRSTFPAPTGSNGGGGIFVTGTETIDLKNTIISGNTTVVGGADCEGAINSLDYNLIQSTTNCTVNGTTTHNITGVSPNLDVLADNGGATQTMALLVGSPAIDAGNDATCASTDQRSIARPIGTHCDIGAYEGDFVAPTTTIDNNPSNPSNDTTPTFTFSGNDGTGSGVASFMCQIDSGGYIACSTPFTSSALLDGSHTFYVYAIDNAGNTDASPASFTWQVDTTAPNSTIDSTPSNPSNDNTPTFTFSGNDGTGSGVASFMCQMDSGGYSACSTPFTSSALLDGSHTFYVYAVDNDGNADASPASFTWKIDTVAPTVMITSAATDPTNTSPILVAIQFSEMVTGFIAGDISLGNGTVVNFVVVDGDTYSFDLTPNGQGLVTVDIAAGVASDLSGNGNMAATQFSRTYTAVFNLFLPLILR